MHRRAAIVEAIRVAVQAAIDASAYTLTVTTGRTNPVSFNALPAVNVMVGAEEVTDEGDFAGEDDQARSLEVILQVWITADHGQIDPAADDVALEVERGLWRLAAPGVWDSIRYRGSADPERDDLEAPVAIRELAYRVDFVVDGSDPQ